MTRKKTLPWEKLDKMLPNMPDKEVAKKLGLPLSSVRTYGQRKGLKKTYRNWTKKELAVLKKEYQFGIAWVMDKLPGRSKWAIINKYREITNLR